MRQRGCGEQIWGFSLGEMEALGVVSGKTWPRFKEESSGCMWRKDHSGEGCGEWKQRPGRLAAA